jgi:hypothetical protein
MNQIKLTRLRRYGVYATSLGLWLTGGGWLIAHYWLIKHGEYGPETSPLEPWALEVHGAFAFIALWFMGLLWGVHVIKGWQAHRGRWSGGLLLGLLGLLTLTGYLLYYMGDEDLRGWASIIHWAIGLSALPLFLWHRFVKKKASPRQNRRSAKH